MPLHFTLPGSKSVTQRALVIAGLRPGPSTLVGALDCDDSRALSRGLTAMGRVVSWRGDQVRVASGALQRPKDVLFCGNAGTTLRFLSAFSLLIEGPLVLDGVERMRQRPIAGLGDALRQLGVELTYPLKDGFPPLRLERRKSAFQAQVDTSLSSQFASALLLVAPLLEGGLYLDLVGAQVSRPYINMTLAMMQQAGARWKSHNEGARIVVEPGGYQEATAPYEVEPDWSTAGLVQAACFAAGTPFSVDRLLPPEQSLQGDAKAIVFFKELEEVGEHRLDLSDQPDLLPPLSAAALFAPGESLFLGIAHTRVKECDRPKVLREAFAACGAVIEESHDRMVVRPAPLSAPKQALDPADDHRMAMAFGVLQLRLPELKINSPECVSKSFPGWWQLLESIARWRRQVEAVFASKPGLALVGPRAAGKSTLGPLLAAWLDTWFIDADRAFEEHFGLHPSQWILEYGEESFRLREVEISDELLARSGGVIATGGGAVLSSKLRERLAARHTVWLNPPIEVLEARLADTDRPALHGQSAAAEIAQLVAERAPLYNEVSDLELTEVASPMCSVRQILDAMSSLT